MPLSMELRKLGKQLYDGWLRFAKVLSVVNTTILLTLIYVLLIGPIALIIRVLGKDPLDRTLRKPGTFWRTRPPGRHSLEEIRRQF